jgi:type IV pilus assembly protein PilM
MKRTARVTIGIDVTETAVSMVMLRRTAAGCTVLDAAAVALPPGVVQDGRITDPKALAKVLKSVKRRRMQTGLASVSLPIRGTLTRILPLTEQDPQRIGQFVREELKQYAVLSGRETAWDFRVLTTARQDVRGTVLVAAADRENVAALTVAGQLAGLQIGVIEPAAVACTRLLGTERPSASAERGLMVVLLKEATLTLCVFRRGLLDFIRTEALASGTGEPEAAGRRIAEEVTAVMRFYSVRQDAPKQWSIALADDTRASVLSQVQATLGTDVAVGSVSLVTPDHLPGELGIDLRGHKALSLTALGLASRAGGIGEDASSVNLLPPGVSVARSAKKEMFVVANVAAALMLLAIVGTGIVAYTSRHISRNIADMRQQSLQRGESSLPAATAEKAYLKTQMENLSGEIRDLQTLNASHPTVNWVQFLTEVRSACPARRVQLRDLTFKGGNVVTIHGNAVSPEAVRAFVEALNASSQVRRAAPPKWSKTSLGLIDFEIQYALTVEKAF